MNSEITSVDADGQMFFPFMNENIFIAPFDLDQSMEQCKEYCERMGYDYEKIVKAASRHFKGNLPRRELTDEEREVMVNFVLYGFNDCPNDVKMKTESYHLDDDFYLSGWRN